MKPCSKCKIPLPFSEFYKDRKTRSGFSSWCKYCKKQDYKDHLEERRRQHREWYKEHKQEHASRMLKVRYGITTKEQIELYRKQKGLCGLCKFPLKFSEAKTDHDPSTGEVRGLLHHKCNVGLHYVEDKIFKSLALEYLTK
jgi:Recombination endonuclease VII